MQTTEGGVSLCCHVGESSQLARPRDMGKQRAKSRGKGASRVNGSSKAPAAMNLAAQSRIPALDKV